MNDQNLVRLVELSAVFKDAVEAYLAAHPKTQQKMVAAIKPDELENAMLKVQDLAGDALGYAFGGEPSDEFLRQNLEVVELTVDFASRVMKPKKLAALVPDELKNAADVAALTAENSPKFAALCAFKPA